MKTKHHRSPSVGVLNRMDGSALIMTLAFLLLLSVTMASLLQFAGTEKTLVSRRSSHIEAVYGSETAIRRSMAQIRELYFSSYSTNSYLTGGLAAPTDAQLSALVSSKGPLTLGMISNRFSYSNFAVNYSTGTSTNHYVSHVIAENEESLSTYSGLTSQRAQIVCSATASSSTAPYAVPATVQQTFSIDYIPVFQYAVFYNMDMEIFNGPVMTVNGKVHSNGTLYYAPASTLTINSTLTTSGGIERGIKVWNSSKPTLLTSTSASIQSSYGGSQAAYAADPANWVSLDSTVSGYGEASFLVKNSTTGSLVDFRTSSSPVTFFDSESTGWAGGALTKWGGGVKSKDQGIDTITPPVPTDVIAASSDPTNPYHVMIEPPTIDSGGVVTDSVNSQAAKMGVKATLLIQRTGTNTVFRLRDTSGVWHKVSNLRNAGSIVPTANTTIRDQREYLQNGSVKMTVTDFDVGALYGASGASNAGAMDSSGVWQTTSNTAVNSDTSGTAFTPVPFDGIVYIYDDNFSSTRKPAIRIKNGATLYDKDSNASGNNGLAIVTENPVFIQGNFNSDANINTAPEKTGASKENVPPAMIAADVVTVLSTAWSSGDDDPGGTASASNYFNRTGGTNTEINAAVLAGVNQSSQSVAVNSFNGTTGGVNNFMRFLEDWDQTFKYSGSMVSLWYAKQSSGAYKEAGTANGVFSAPTRDWAFNTDFLDPNKLPRCTPIIRVYTTCDWKNF